MKRMDRTCQKSLGTKLNFHNWHWGEKKKKMQHIRLIQKNKPRVYFQKHT